MESSDSPTLLPMLPSRRGNDLSTTWTGFLLLWGAPISIGVVASATVETGRIPIGLAYGLWILAALWFGFACLLNARRCGRVHCWVDGIGMPVLAGVGAIALTGLFPLSLATFGSAFWAILLASFAIEVLWKRYV